MNCSGVLGRTNLLAMKFWPHCPLILYVPRLYGNPNFFDRGWV